MKYPLCTRTIKARCYESLVSTTFEYASSIWDPYAQKEYQGTRSKPIYEPPHDKTNKMICAPSEDSDQSGHPDAQADLSLRWAHVILLVLS